MEDDVFPGSALTFLDMFVHFSDLIVAQEKPRIKLLF